MKLTINDNSKISVIQEEFTKQFPYLKIEFFSKSHNVGAGSSRDTMKPNIKTLGECRTIHNSGTLTIVPQMTVAYIEQSFRNIYGLSVQIFRKSGKVWLETTVTDNWTLDKQNRQGESLSLIA